MVENTLVTVISYVFSLFYGLAAIYLVFETKNCCPFRWPLLFGLVSTISHFAINELPPWWPPEITQSMLIALLLLVFLILGAELLRRLIDEYDLRYPWEPILEWYRDDTEVTIFPYRYR